MNAQIEIRNNEPGLGHQLRSPLNAIIGFTGTLLMKLAGPLTTEQERQLEMVRSSARELLETVNNLSEEPKALRPDDGTSGPPAAATKPAKILVVDDSPVNLYLMKSTLEPIGHRVFAATGPGEALRMAKEELPDVIVSDVNMRGETGFDLIEAVKNDPVLKTIPFVFITSTFWNPEYKRKGLACGATAWILRPIDPETLIHEIEVCLQSRKEGLYV